jgi:hypothetical protein
MEYIHRLGDYRASVLPTWTDFFSDPWLAQETYEKWRSDGRQEERLRTTSHPAVTQ